MINPYTNHYYDKSDAYAAGQYDGYQMTIDRFRWSVNPLYLRGVRDGQSERQ